MHYGSHGIRGTKFQSPHASDKPSLHVTMLGRRGKNNLEINNCGGSERQKCVGSTLPHGPHLFKSQKCLTIRWKMPRYSLSHLNLTQCKVEKNHMIVLGHK